MSFVGSFQQRDGFAYMPRAQTLHPCLEIRIGRRTATAPRRP
jgi:hypothetical protein